MLSIDVKPYWNSDRLFDHGWTVTFTLLVPAWAHRAWRRVRGL